jgi:hypothetical protein
MNESKVCESYRQRGNRAKQINDSASLFDREDEDAYHIIEELE